jgi:hypothetical protein
MNDRRLASSLRIMKRNLGVVFTEAAALDALAADCARDGGYEVFSAASSVRVARGTGGSVNPVVVK